MAVEWKDLPIEIQEKMLERQVEQGNPRSPEAFIYRIYAGNSSVQKGFDWSNSPEGSAFWRRIVDNKDFDLFYEVHPEKKVKLAFSTNTAYHCRTEEIAKKLLAEAHRQGFKWGSGDSFAEKSFYSYNKKDTCYLITDGTYSNIDYCKNKYTIVDAEEFLNQTNKTHEIQRTNLTEQGQTGGTGVRLPREASRIAVGSRLVGNVQSGFYRRERIITNDLKRTVLKSSYSGCSK